MGLTPGEILANMLNGDGTNSKEDFEKATVYFFAKEGVHCTITTNFENISKKPCKHEFESDGGNCIHCDMTWDEINTIEGENK